ncbi:MAG: hypothetical protein ACLU4J_07120 [Butyricimonas paravirosa]
MTLLYACFDDEIMIYRVATVGINYPILSLRYEEYVIDPVIDYRVDSLNLAYGYVTYRIRSDTICREKC